jgi:hypothetical protein
MLESTLIQRPFVRLLLDMVEAIEWQALEAKDQASQKSQWHTKSECENCGRPFRAVGNQGRCRRRDCIHALESTEQRKARAREEEIALIAASQQREAEKERSGRLWVDRYNPVRQDPTRTESIMRTFRLDAPIGSSNVDHISRTLNDLLIGPRVPKYLIEWHDPTYDQAEPTLELWLERQRLHK